MHRVNIYGCLIIFFLIIAADVSAQSSTKITITMTKGTAFLIQKGSSDGLIKGNKFIVYRLNGGEGKRIGEAVAVIVKENKTGLRAMNLIPNYNVQVGDYIIPMDKDDLEILETLNSSESAEAEPKIKQESQSNRDKNYYKSDYTSEVYESSQPGNIIIYTDEPRPVFLDGRYIGIVDQKKLVQVQPGHHVVSFFSPEHMQNVGYNIRNFQSLDRQSRAYPQYNTPGGNVAMALQADHLSEDIQKINFGTEQIYVEPGMFVSATLQYSLVKEVEGKRKLSRLIFGLSMICLFVGLNIAKKNATL